MLSASMFRLYHSGAFFVDAHLRHLDMTISNPTIDGNADADKLLTRPLLEMFRDLWLDGTGVEVNALHPATYMPTKIVPSPVSTLEEGVDATVRLAVGEDVDGVTGA